MPLTPQNAVNELTITTTACDAIASAPCAQSIKVVLTPMAPDGLDNPRTVAKRKWEDVG